MPTKTAQADAPSSRFDPGAEGSSAVILWGLGIGVEGITAMWQSGIWLQRRAASPF